MRDGTNRLPIEELIIYTLLMGVGVIPIWDAAGGAIGVEATIGIIMIAIGAIGMITFVASRLRARASDSPPPPR